MELEVNIDAEKVQTEIVKAITESVIGEEIQKAVDKAFKERTYGGGSVVQQAVDSAVHEAVRVRCRELVREPGPIRDSIEAKLREALTGDAMEKIVTAFAHQLGLITSEDLHP